MNDLEEALRGVLATVELPTRVPPDMVRRLHRRHTRRRALTASLTTMAVLALVVGSSALMRQNDASNHSGPVSAAASAAGLIPAGALSAFPDNAGSSDHERMDLSTAKLVVSIPGPPGQRLDVWVAHGAHGYHCVSFVFTPLAATTGRAVPSLGDFAGDSCGPPPKHGDVFNSSSGGAGANGESHYALTAGAAVRADVRLPDGSVVPATTGNGWIAGWFPPGLDTAGAVLTGYAADGSIVGHAYVGTAASPASGRRSPALLLRATAGP